MFETLLKILGGILFVFLAFLLGIICIVAYYIAIPLLIGVGILGIIYAANQK